MRLMPALSKPTASFQTKIQVLTKNKLLSRSNIKRYNISSNGTEDPYGLKNWTPHMDNKYGDGENHNIAS